MRDMAFHCLKSHVSHYERWPFGMRKATFHNGSKNTLLC